MKVLLVGPLEKTGGVSNHTKAIAKALESLGIRISIYDISIEKTYSTPVLNVFKLYKRTLGLGMKIICNAKYFDLVHVQASGPMGGFIPALTAAFLCKIIKFKLIISFHYSKTESFIVKNRIFINFVLEKISKLILVSNRQRKYFNYIFKYKYDDKLLVIYNGYDNEKLCYIDSNIAKKYLGINKTSKMIINVSNLIPVKGHQCLIYALKLLESLNFSCYICGIGSLSKKLMSQIEELKLKDKVKLAGFIPESQLKYWLNAADLFVLPSLNEGNPTVMFEALGVGLPFVGTKVGGIPEIIVSEDYGLLAEPGNAKDLAEKILIALNKQWDREKIRDYAKQFTWDNIARQLLKVYEEVLEKDSDLNDVHL